MAIFDELFSSRKSKRSAGRVDIDALRKQYDEARKTDRPVPGELCMSLGDFYYGLDDKDRSFALYSQGIRSFLREERWILAETLLSKKARLFGDTDPADQLSYLELYIGRRHFPRAADLLSKLSKSAGDPDPAFIARLTQILDASSDLPTDLSVLVGEYLCEAGRPDLALAYLRMALQNAQARRDKHGAQIVHDRLAILDPVGQRPSPETPSAPTAAPTTPDGSSDTKPPAPDVRASSRPAAPRTSSIVPTPSVEIDEARTRITGVDVRDAEGFLEIDRLLSQFREGLRLSTGDAAPQVHYDLGHTFLAMGLYEDATREFTLCLHDETWRFKAAGGLGESLVLDDKPETALAILSNLAVPDDAEGAAILYWLARSLEALGQMSRARAYYDRVDAAITAFLDVPQRLANLRK